jgi:hypothetical protein
MVSMVAAPIGARPDGFGCLMACSADEAAFVEADLGFAQSLGNVLASAVERLQTRQTGTHLHPDAYTGTLHLMARKKRAKGVGWSAPPKARPRPQPKRSPGARVARVAVDDETWEAFRAACGEMPASVRLGQLVEADVIRATGPEDADPRTAVRELRERLDALERLLPP